MQRSQANWEIGVRSAMSDPPRRDSPTPFFSQPWTARQVWRSAGLMRVPQPKWQSTVPPFG